MKKNNEITNNKKYEEVNASLTERSAKIAKIIRAEMECLNVYEIGDYKIKTLRSGSGYSHTALYILNDDGNYQSLEDEKSNFFCGDFDCHIEAASTTKRIQFLDCTRELLEEIDKIKEERIAKAEKVLKETESWLETISEELEGGER